MDGTPATAGAKAGRAIPTHPARHQRGPAWHRWSPSSAGIPMLISARTSGEAGAVQEQASAAPWASSWTYQQRGRCSTREKNTASCIHTGVKEVDHAVPSSLPRRCRSSVRCSAAPHLYALSTGALQEPSRLQNRRCFVPADLDRIREYFAGRPVPREREHPNRQQ